MPVDIFVYALIAAGLVFWLRNILGTRHGDERERPNPYARAAQQAGEETLDGEFVVEDAENTPQDRISDLAENPTSTMSVDNKTAENGLLDISRADKNFEISEFLNAAQDAFVYVVEAFAEGDRETLQGLLDKPVYDAFDGAIKAREESGETLEAEIQAIRNATVLNARLENRRKAFITVRFMASQITVTRNSDGEVIDGHEEKPSEMIDIWTFTRDVKSKDPRWFVVETRSDDADGDDADGDAAADLPDTH